MGALENTGFRRFILVSLFIYVALGFFGNLWLADEFDYERTMITAYAGVPPATYFFGNCLINSQWWSKRPRLFFCLLSWLVISFAWGNAMLLNAIGGNQAEIVDIESHEQALDIAFKRGGLGWLYRERW